MGTRLTLFRADIQKIFLRAQSLQLSWLVSGWLQGIGVRGKGWFLQETVVWWSWTKRRRSET